tara:strand:- start:1034 stop:1183 length:150 start_codon:yes stop_codon:yes gene_type:complete
VTGGLGGGQMEDWDVYYLFVRNRNVTTNGLTERLAQHRSWEPVEREREK